MQPKIFYCIHSLDRHIINLQGEATTINSLIIRVKYYVFCFGDVDRQNIVVRLFKQDIKIMLHICVHVIDI